MKSTWTALCLTVFMTGCGTTETVVVTKTVPALPPAYLYDSEALPRVPAGLPASDRTSALLDAFAARGDVIKRDQKQKTLMDNWIEEIRKLYPEAVEHPLNDVKAEPGTPEESDSDGT